MKVTNDWYDSFIQMLHEEYPSKTKLTEALMDLLIIEREAVHRRLRKDVMFTAHEMVKIISALGISLDELLDFHNYKTIFQMQFFDYFKLSEEDINFLRERNQKLKGLKDSTDSEYMMVCNNLSRSLTSGFIHLHKFNIFKWAYEYYNKEKGNIHYSRVNISEELLTEMTNYFQCVKYAASTTYVLDARIFQGIVSEVKFFHSMFLITDEEKEFIKKDLYNLLKYLLEIANTGYFPDTNNKINLYISELNINSNYSYFYDGKVTECRTHIFNLYDMVLHNQKMEKVFKKWMWAKKETSIKISESDAKFRVEFFRKQHELIDTL